jgi:hypothetical protein
MAPQNHRPPYSQVSALLQNILSRISITLNVPESSLREFSWN